MMPLIDPTMAASRKRQVEGDGGCSEEQAGKGDHRADREVELAPDHQHGRADGQNAQLCGWRHEVDDARGCEHGRVSGHQEEYGNENKTCNCPQFRTLQYSRSETFSLDAFVPDGPIGAVRHGFPPHECSCL
jgi:hypothetical protein